MSDDKEQRAAEKRYRKEIKKAKKAKGSFSRAFFWMILTAVFYIGIPLFMFDYVMVQYADNADWTNVKPFFERWMYAGIVLVVLSFPLHYFGKGSKPRLLMSIIYLVASVGWLVYVLNFGDLSNFVTVTINGSSYSFGIVLNLMLYLLIFFKLLKVLSLYADYKDHKKKYLEKTAPLNGSKQ